MVAALPAVALALGFLVLYLSQRHTGLFENGGELMDMWRRGIVIHAHALLLPLARLLACLGLAGSPPVPDRAISLVSALAAALCVGAIVTRATCWSGRPEALLAGVVLGLSPALRFYAGAVETRALACGAAALAGALAGSVAPTHARALARVALAYALACAAHASLVALGPALLLLHADAEVRAGRRVSLSRLAGAGGLLVAAALATAGVVYAIDQLFNPQLPGGASPTLFYFQVAADWGRAVGRPHPLSWITSEILGPANALLPLALVGVVPLARRAPWRAAALVLWTLVVCFTSYSVGSRQFGGYFVAALPPLGWLAAEGLRHLVHARSGRAALGSAALATLGLLAFPAALDAWHASGGDAVHGAGAGPAAGATYRSWPIQRADLALPWPAAVGAALAAVHWLAWVALALAAGLCAGIVGASRDSDPRDTEQPAAQGAAHTAGPRAAGPARALPALVVVSLALGLQVVGGETFRQRWPTLWFQETRDYCEAIRADLGPHGQLFTVLPTPHLAWQFTYYLGERWTEIGQEARLPPARRPGWLAELEAQLEHVRAEGGAVLIDRHGFSQLEARQESPLARAAVHRWLAEGRIETWAPPAPRAPPASR